MRNEGFSDKPTRILIIDDDQKLCSLVQDYLAPHGYDVAAAYSGQSGLDAALKGDFKAIILDVMLPGMDGFEVLQQLRREINTPVLMLTSRGDETDRIVGLEMGADDYVPKTFSTRELLARLRAVIRRAGNGAVDRVLSDQIAEVGPVRVDHMARAARLNNEALDLTPVEFELLFQLARSPGRVLSRDQLLDRVSGRDYDVYDRSIDVHVSSLRRKLNDDPRCPRFIKTVRSIGYMFIDPEQE